MGTMTGPSRMHDLWDEAGKSLLQAVADLGVFGREIQMMVMPSQRNLTEITSKSNPKSLALGDGGQENHAPEHSGSSNSRPGAHLGY